MHCIQTIPDLYIYSYIYISEDGNIIQYQLIFRYLCLCTIKHKGIRGSPELNCMWYIYIDIKTNSISIHLYIDTCTHTNLLKDMLTYSYWMQLLCPYTTSPLYTCYNWPGWFTLIPHGQGHLPPLLWWWWYRIISANGTLKEGSVGICWLVWLTRWLRSVGKEILGCFVSLWLIVFFGGMTSVCLQKQPVWMVKCGHEKNLGHPSIYE